MITDDVALRSACELAAGLTRRDFSSRELLTLFLDRIDRFNPAVNAVVTLDAERAMRDATAADEARARGDRLGPLHGLPITVKDAIETAGIRSTGGAVELADHVPAHDAPAVARLRGAGAIVFGKTNLPRWSMDTQSFNDLFGTTNNPWALDRSPGGSSGGAAAAVAAGFTSFELGTDIGGSIRLPAHCCGVFGWKPSYGLVPQRGYLDHVGGGTTDADINVFGPLARSAADLEMLADVLAGPEPERAPAWRVDLPVAPRDLRGLRVATWFDDPRCPSDHECITIFERAAATAQAAGATLVDDAPPTSFEELTATYLPLIVAATSSSRPDDQADAISGTHRAWLRANEARAALRQRWADWFRGVDVLLCPVAAIPAFRHDQRGDLLERSVEVNGVKTPLVSTGAWCGIIGVLGLPSVSTPIGRTAAGLPVGLQVVAPYLHDRRAMRVAGAIGHYAVPPGFA